MYLTLCPSERYRPSYHRTGRINIQGIEKDPSSGKPVWQRQPDGPETG